MFMWPRDSERSEFGDRAVLDEPRVVPSDTLEVGRHHVLWPRVERFCDRVSRVRDRGPVTGEDVSRLTIVGGGVRRARPPARSRLVASAHSPTLPLNWPSPPLSLLSRQRR